MQKRHASIPPFAARTANESAGAAPTSRRFLWLALLVAATIGFSFGFACAVPFAALGAVAALTLRRPDALLVAGGAWLANQIIGFAFLSYPWDANTLAWGLALGIIAVLTTLAAQSIGRRLASRGAFIVSIMAFLGAFIVYEGGLFIVAALALGGTEDFAPDIMRRIIIINAAAFASLLLLCRLGRALGLTRRPALGFLMTERHA